MNPTLVISDNWVSFSFLYRAGEVSWVEVEGKVFPCAVPPSSVIRSQEDLDTLSHTTLAGLPFDLSPPVSTEDRSYGDVPRLLFHSGIVFDTQGDITFPENSILAPYRSLDFKATFKPGSVVVGYTNFKKGLEAEQTIFGGDIEVTGDIKLKFCICNGDVNVTENSRFMVSGSRFLGEKLRVIFNSGEEFLSLLSDCFSKSSIIVSQGDESVALLSDGVQTSPSMTARYEFIRSSLQRGKVTPFALNVVNSTLNGSLISYVPVVFLNKNFLSSKEKTFVAPVFIIKEVDGGEPNPIQELWRTSDATSPNPIDVQFFMLYHSLRNFFPLSDIYWAVYADNRTLTKGTYLRILRLGKIEGFPIEGDGVSHCALISSEERDLRLLLAVELSGHLHLNRGSFSKLANGHMWEVYKDSLLNDFVQGMLSLSNKGLKELMAGLSAFVGGDKRLDPTYQEANNRLIQFLYGEYPGKYRQWVSLPSGDYRGVEVIPPQSTFQITRLDSFSPVPLSWEGVSTTGTRNFIPLVFGNTTFGDNVSFLSEEGFLTQEWLTSPSSHISSIVVEGNVSFGLDCSIHQLLIIKPDVRGAAGGNEVYLGMNGTIVIDPDKKPEQPPRYLAGSGVKIVSDIERRAKSDYFLEDIPLAVGSVTTVSPAEFLDYNSQNNRWEYRSYWGDLPDTIHVTVATVQLEHSTVSLSILQH
jgi:hypothetical protein